MDESRENAIENGASISTGGVNFNYVDTAVLERLGIGRYSTKKKDGNNFIRIVAPSAKGAFAKEIWKHPNVGSDNVTYLCLDKMYGKRCPVCEYIKGNPGAAKELNLSLRYLLFVVDITSRDTEDEGPKWFDCPITVYKEICSLSKDKRTGAKIDPTDPDNGRDIEFVRKDGRRTSYGGFELKKNDPIPDSWFKDLPTFDEVLLVPDPDEMEQAVLGVKSSSRESKPEKDNRGGGRRDSGRRESGGDSSRRRSETDRSERRESRDNDRARGEGSRRDSRREPEDSAQSNAIRSKLDEIKERKRNRENGND